MNVNSSQRLRGRLPEDTAKTKGTAAKTLEVSGGDAEKVITMTHLAVGGDLAGEPQLSARELTCLKSSGL
jgi:hypothetical protein